MFDVSFSELLVVAVVALLVIGPEKLPKVARTIGALTGRIQRYASQVKEEVNRELRFEELQKLQQEIKQSVGNVQASVQQQLAEVESTIINKDESITKPVAKTNRKPRVAAIKSPKINVAAEKVIIQTAAISQTLNSTQTDAVVKKVLKKAKKVES